MPTLIYVLLLTLHLSSGSTKDDDLSQVQRTQLWPEVKSPDYATCQREKDKEIARFNAIWTILEQRTDPTSKLTKVTGICVGVAPNDTLPVDKDDD